MKISTTLPSSKIRLAIPASTFRAAKPSGVNPSIVRTSTLAPFWSNISQTSIKPRPQARWSDVTSALFLALTSVFGALRRDWTMALFPVRVAKCNADICDSVCRHGSAPCCNRSSTVSVLLDLRLDDKSFFIKLLQREGRSRLFNNSLLLTVS